MLNISVKTINAHVAKALEIISSGLKNKSENNLKKMESG